MDSDWVFLFQVSPGTPPPEVRVRRLLKQAGRLGIKAVRMLTPVEVEALTSERPANPQAGDDGTALPPLRVPGHESTIHATT
jgi:hypothetical protein